MLGSGLGFGLFLGCYRDEEEHGVRVLGFGLGFGLFLGCYRDEEEHGAEEERAREEGSQVPR